MQCPTSQTLALLLSESSDSVHEETLWKHLEQCPLCRAELDRISDDPELQQWRDGGSAEFERDVEVDAIAQLVEQLADRDTGVDSIGNRATTIEQGLDHSILDSFQPSSDPKELGIIGQFRIKRTLGHGGMAIVYEAIDTELDRIVALKILRTNQTDTLSRERFIREARALAGVKNPHVVAIFSVHSNFNQQPRIAMEMVDEGSLQDRLRLQQDIPPRMAAKWIAEAADGLAAAHHAGLIHRDIKPSNILLAKQGGECIAKLADFGLARFIAVENRETQSGVLLGTPAYMSPEHIATPDACDAKSDIYSLGVTMYELLTGEVPFRGAVHTVLQRIGRDEPTSPRAINSAIPLDLETVCLKAMHREPSRRYASAQDFADDLNRWLDGRPIMARPASTLEHFVRWSRRNRRVASMLAAIASLLIILASVSTYFAVTIREAGRILKKEKGIVEEKSRQLQIAADDAKSQRQIAMDSLGNLVTKVQSELAQRSGTLPLRESILDVAVKGLDQITQGTDPTDIDLMRVQAHVQKGQIYDSLGRSDRSTLELEKAIALAESYYKQSPDRTDVQESLGNALLERADIATRSGLLDQAMALYQRILPMREAAMSELALETEDVKSFNVRKALYTVLQRIADIHYHRNEWDQSASVHLRALDHAQQNTTLFPSNPIAKRDLSLEQQRLGSIEVLRNHPEVAAKHFEEAIEINRSLLASDSDNKLYAGDLGFLLGELSKQTSAQGDSALALLQAKESISQCEKVAAMDTQDMSAKMKAAMSWTNLYYVYFNDGNFADAESAINEFLQRNNQLVEANPTASKFPMLSSAWLDSRFDMQSRQGKWDEAIVSLQSSLEYLERCQQATDAMPDALVPSIHLKQVTITGLKLALTGIDSTVNLTKVDPDVLFTAKVSATYQAGFQGDMERVVALSQWIESNPSNNPFLYLNGSTIVARAFALCYRHLKEMPRTEKKDEQMQVAFQGVIQNLKPIVKHATIVQNPSFLNTIFNDPDFKSLRDLPEFRNLLTSVK